MHAKFQKTSIVTPETEMVETQARDDEHGHEINIISTFLADDDVAPSVLHGPAAEVDRGPSNSTMTSKSSESRFHSNRKIDEVKPPIPSQGSFYRSQSLSNLASNFEFWVDSIWIGAGDILDWGTILILTLGIMYRFLYIRNCREFHNHVRSIEFNFSDHFDTMVSGAILVKEGEESLRAVAICAVAAGLLQLFRYLSFDESFGIVTSTIYYSLLEVLPMLLILVIVFTAYGVCTQMFGQQLGDFQTLTHSVTSLFLMILGEYGSYFESESSQFYKYYLFCVTVIFVVVKKISPAAAVFYFWTFIIVILFILLNMLLAVILFVYDERFRIMKDKAEMQNEIGKKVE